MNNKEYRPTLAQMRTFVTIAENKHFGTAASKLNISQPSLSQALVALEHGLGIQLIERSTRKVIVTAAGEHLLPYAKAALEAADAFLAQSRGAQGTLAGPVTIGIIPTVAPYILSGLLAAIQEELPELEPRIVEEQTKHLVRQLREGQLDVIVCASPVEAASMKELDLYRERFVVALPTDHPLAGRKDLTLNDIDMLDLLLLDDGHCLRDQTLELCRKASLNPSEATNTITRASSLTTIMQLVSAGLGSTLVPESALATECSRPGIAVAHFDPKVEAYRDVVLACRSSSTRTPDFQQLGRLVTKAFNKATENNASLNF